MLNLRTFALLFVVPIAACSATAADNGSDDDEKGGSGGAGGTGAGAGGTGQGGAGPTGGVATGGVQPTGGVQTGGVSGVSGVSGTPTGGASGTPPTGGASGVGMTGGASGAAGGPAGASGTPTGGAGGATGGGAGKGGGAGSAGKGGSAGSGGSPVTCPAPVTTLVGWATQGGMTTGGGTAAATTITSASASQLTDSTARVLSFSTLSGTVRVGSNKTLQGASGTATINGKIEIDGASNIILKNFRINASSSGDDGMTIQDSNHIWIDHLEVYDAEDGNMDIVQGSDYITVSWTKFRYSGTGDHNFSNLIASDDSDSGSYRITFHHNWWANNVSERMPRVRFGQVHVFNNLYGIGTGAASNDHCIRAAFRANIRAESNYFDIVNTPHEIAEDSSGAAILQATTCANNTSAGSPAGCNIEYLSLNRDGNPANRGTAFTPPYTAAMTPADCVKAQVSNASTGAGPH